jgi:2-methylcitrate dehydratase PrpD
VAGVQDERDVTTQRRREQPSGKRNRTETKKKIAAYKLRLATGETSRSRMLAHLEEAFSKVSALVHGEY